MMKKQIIGLKAISTKEYNPLAEIHPPTSRFKPPAIMSRSSLEQSLSHTSSLRHGSSSSGNDHLMSKVSLILSEEDDLAVAAAIAGGGGGGGGGGRGSGATHHQQQQQYNENNNFTGKYLSKTWGLTKTKQGGGGGGGGGLTRKTLSEIDYSSSSIASSNTNQHHPHYQHQHQHQHPSSSSALHAITTIEPIDSLYSTHSHDLLSRRSKSPPIYRNKRTSSSSSSRGRRRSPAAVAEIAIPTASRPTSGKAVAAADDVLDNPSLPSGGAESSDWTPPIQQQTTAMLPLETSISLSSCPPHLKMSDRLLSAGSDDLIPKDDEEEGDEGKGKGGHLTRPTSSSSPPALPSSSTTNNRPNSNIRLRPLSKKSFTREALVLDRPLSSTIPTTLGNNQTSLSPNNNNNNPAVVNQEETTTTTTTTIPSFIPHKKILGWKLTSIKKRKELIELFDMLSQTQSQRHHHRDGNSNSNRHVLPSSPPQARRKQLLLQQLEQRLKTEIEATSPAYVDRHHHHNIMASSSSQSFFNDEDLLLPSPEVIAQDQATLARLSYRQSQAYEQFLERSLQCRISYKSKLGIEQIMNERRTIQKLTEKQHSINDSSITYGRSLQGQIQKSLSKVEENAFSIHQSTTFLEDDDSYRYDDNAMNSAKILNLTMKSFDNYDPKLDLTDRPSSRLLKSRSALHSRNSHTIDHYEEDEDYEDDDGQQQHKQQQHTQGIGKSSSSPSQILYDFPYSIHRPLDRMDILQSVETRAHLEPLLHHGEGNSQIVQQQSADGLRQLFSREASDLIASTSRPNTKPSTRSSMNKNTLLQQYATSDNSLLRMLVQDQEVDDQLSAELSQILDLGGVLENGLDVETQVKTGPADDQLVEAFIAASYKVARKKKKVKMTGDPSLMSTLSTDLTRTSTIGTLEEGTQSDFIDGDIDGDEDDGNASYISYSSLGDQSSALYDLILPTTTAPPPHSAIPPTKDEIQTEQDIITELIMNDHPILLSSKQSSIRRSIVKEEEEHSEAFPLDGDGLQQTVDVVSNIPVNPW
eukprot:scaffold98_cov248-Ochromonas_danica.AAC.2